MMRNFEDYINHVRKNDLTIDDIYEMYADGDIDHDDYRELIMAYDEVHSNEEDDLC